MPIQQYHLVLVDVEKGGQSLALPVVQRHPTRPDEFTPNLDGIHHGQSEAPDCVHSLPFWQLLYVLGFVWQAVAECTVDESTSS